MFESGKCNRVCLIIGALFGLLILLLAYFNADFNMVVSLILGALAFYVGNWVLRATCCGDQPEGSMTTADDRVASEAPAASSPETTAEATASGADLKADVSSSGENWTDAVSADSGKAGDARGATDLKPSAPLADEATLRDDVGSWKYGGETDASDATATAKAAEKDGDYDGDGVVEGKEEGEKPATLTAARGGKADDLKQIKGVGPKMEDLLNSLGFYHFDQLASWSDQEVAWVDANLEGFKGRVSRDNWVDQAKTLAAGGETEFSKRVEDGDVY